MMKGSTTKVFASWKRVMTGGTYNLMVNWWRGVRVQHLHKALIL
jgi:hypothetical protein